MKKTVLISAVCVLSATMLTLGNIGFPRARELVEGKALNLFYRIRGPIQTSKKIAVVAFDSRSLDQYGRWPWPRDRIAHLLERTCACGPAIVAFDITFSQNEMSDEAVAATDSLARSASRCGRVLFPYYFLREDRLAVVNVAEPPADIAATAMRLPGGLSPNAIPAITQAKQLITSSEKITAGGRSGGHLSKVLELDGSLRREANLVNFGPALLPSLGMTTVSGMGSAVRPIGLSDGGEDLLVGEYTIPLDAYGCSYLNYYGPPGSFLQVSASDLLGGRFDKSKLAGKIVLVGLTAQGHSDVYNLPFSTRLPTVEKLATSIDNTINNRWLVRRPGYEKWELLLMILLVGGFGVALVRLPMRRVLPILGAVTVLILGFSHLCFAFQRVWIQTAVPALSPWLALCILTVSERFLKKKK